VFAERWLDVAMLSASGEQRVCINSQEQTLSTSTPVAHHTSLPLQAVLIDFTPFVRYLKSVAVTIKEYNKE
jgi:hypothetical protein